MTLVLLMVLSTFLTTCMNAGAATLTTTQTTQTSGVTLTQEQQAYTTSQNLVANQNTLMTLAATTTVTLTSAANSLTNALKTNTTYRNDLNLLYGTAITTSGTSSDYDRTTLNSITAGSGYLQSTWLVKMDKVASLYRALQANTTTRQSFNAEYDTTITATGKPKETDRWALFAVVGTTNYSQTSLLASLTPVVTTVTTGSVTLTSAAISLTNALKTNTTYRNDLNLLYGTTVTTSGATSDFDRTTLNNIAAGGGYVQSTWLVKMDKAASLYGALQANSTARQKYNTTYGTTLKASGTPVQSDRWSLFSTVGTANYNQTNFINSLVGSTPAPSASGLFSATSFWNKKLSATQSLNSNSAAMVSSLVSQATQPWLNVTEYSTPYYVVDSSITGTKSVYLVQNGSTLVWTALYTELMKGVPIPAGAKASSGTDGHISIYDKHTDTLYEFWQFRTVNGQYQASWGGVLHNASTSNGVMPAVKNSSGVTELWGATATSLPMVGGLMMYKEIQAGLIPHVLAMAIPLPKNTFVSPALRSDGSSSGIIPEGTIFRLPANVYIDPNWAPLIKMMVVAARDYGIVIRDRAGSVTFFAEDKSATISGDAYAPYYGGKQLWDVMKQFPYAKLQAIN